MKNKIFAGGIAATLLLSMCCACSPADGTAKLGDIENLNYESGVLTYDEVSGAEGYDVKFTHLGEVVYEDRIKDTAIDVESLGLEGNINLEVYAYKGKSKSEVAQYSFTVLSTFGDVIFEAEDNLQNFGTGKEQSNFRNNSLAHKGAYVGGIDDAGQGVYINYLCPVAGTFDFYAYYCMAPVGGYETAHNDVWVNGEYQTRLDFTQNTGWGGDKFDAAETKTEITLVKGWNTVSVYKNGDSSDNWGGFAELDYFKLVGNGAEYNADDLLSYGKRPEKYRLEAEMGSPRRKNTQSNLYECKNPAIKEYGDKKFSNGFLLGNIENNYDGVEWHFNSPVKAKYRVKIAYASGQFEGSKLAAPTFIVTQEEVGLFKNVVFEEMPKATIADLPYTNWGDVTVSEKYAEIVLEQGKNFIYCLKLDSADSGIFQLDYIDLIFIEEIQEV